VKRRNSQRRERIKTLEQRVEALEEALAKRPTEEEVRSMIQNSREQPRQ
jgi:BMFP domain-containing protein YqiC